MDAFQNLVTQNRLLTEEVKRRVDQLAAINTVAAAVSQSLDLSYTLQIALQAVLNITGAEAGGISLIDHISQEVVLRAQQGWMHDFIGQRVIRVPVGKGMSGRVIAEDKTIIWNNLNESSELHVPSFRDEAFQSLIMSPMHARGRIIGILSLMSYQDTAFGEDIRSPLQAIADTIGVAIENARLYEVTTENKNRLSAILRSSADGIIATDQHGRIQLINSAAQVMLGVDNSIMGYPLREAPLNANLLNGLLFAFSANIGQESAVITATSTGEETYGNESKRIFQITIENERVLSVMVSPVYVDTQLEEIDVTDGWVVVLQDVTHLHQAELARTQFIQAAAHDMRNPLGVALNSLEILERSADNEERELIQIATAGINRINALLDDLLNLEQIQSGIGFDLSSVDIRDVIEEISGEIWHVLEQHRLNYRVELQPNIPDLVIDRRWVMRAIYNYLDNAIKYTPSGGNVLLRVYIKAPFIHIEVVDNGPGISFDQQARIFDRFYRARSTAHIQGTGLGLAIVKSVAELHGGGVYLKSEPDQGSTFGITLRIAPR